MGAIGTHRGKGISTAEFFAREYGSAYAEAVRATATTPGAFFAVVEVDAHEEPRLVPDENGKVRYCWVVRTHTGSGFNNFTYKTQTEFAGPLETACPARLLSLLSPLLDEAKSEGSSQWRKACRRQIQALNALKTVGATVKLPYSLDFDDGVSEDTFVLVERRGRTLRFQRVSDRGFVRLSNAQIADLLSVETKVAA